MSEINKILTSLEKLYRHNYKLIINPNFTSHNNELVWGKYKENKSFEEYDEYYNWIMNEGQYSLMFLDNSAIQIKIQFKDDKLIKASYSYIPQPDNEYIYLRFDLDNKSSRDFVHTDYHIHFGYNNKHIRVSLHCFPSPTELIEFILAFIYNNKRFYKKYDSKFTPSLDELNTKYHHYFKLMKN